MLIIQKKKKLKNCSKNEDRINLTLNNIKYLLKALSYVNYKKTAVWWLTTKVGATRLRLHILQYNRLRLLLKVTFHCNHD